MALPVSAQENGGEPEEEFIPTYSMGDQILSLNLGLFIPLFFTGSPEGVTKTQLTVGGTGFLRWSSFIANNWSVGGEFGGMFAYTPQENTLFMIPVLARTTYYFRFYPFEIPVGMAMGIDFVRYEENSHTDLILMPATGLYWNYDAEWAFGLDAKYWWQPQIYSTADETRYGNFLGVTASVLYHF